MGEIAPAGQPFAFILEAVRSLVAWIPVVVTKCQVGMQNINDLIVVESDFFNQGLVRKNDGFPLGDVLI